MDFTAINAALSEIAAWETGNALVAFAAIGALTTAFIDLVKNLTPIRRWFQTWWIGAWLDERAQSFNDRRAKATASVDGLKTTVAQTQRTRAAAGRGNERRHEQHARS